MHLHGRKFSLSGQADKWIYEIQFVWQFPFLHYWASPGSSQVRYHSYYSTLWFIDRNPAMREFVLAGYAVRGKSKFLVKPKQGLTKAGFPDLSR